MVCELFIGLFMHLLVVTSCFMKLQTRNRVKYAEKMIFKQGRGCIPRDYVVFPEVI